MYINNALFSKISDLKNNNFQYFLSSYLMRLRHFITIKITKIKFIISSFIDN